MNQTLPRALVLVAALAALSPTFCVPLRAQAAGDGDRWRFGVSFGGVSTVGVQVEYQRGSRGLEATLGTWAFRDVSAALVAKQYFGAGALQPFVGAGAWVVAAGALEEGERTGTALVLLAPIGVDWRATGAHHLGLHINVNKAVAVRRSNPEDDLPPAGGLVPLPGVYYRYAR